MENTLVFDQGTDTLRQVPQNYCVAYKKENRWICEPDLACDKELAIKVFICLLEFKFKYAEGNEIINHLIK